VFEAPCDASNIAFSESTSNITLNAMDIPLVHFDCHLHESLVKPVPPNFQWWHTYLLPGIMPVPIILLGDKGNVM